MSTSELTIHCLFFSLFFIHFLVPSLIGLFFFPMFLFFLLRSPSPFLYFVHSFLFQIFKTCFLMPLKWCSCTFPFLCLFSPFLFFFIFSIHATSSPSLLFYSTRKFKKSNLYVRYSWHICLVAWYQLFLFPLVKPSLLEIILARIRKTQNLSSILTPSFFSIRLDQYRPDNSLQL